jgi:hypothetical protein
MERDASSFRRVCNGAMHGRPRAQNRAAPLRTRSGLAARFCTPYEVSDAVVLVARNHPWRGDASRPAAAISHCFTRALRVQPMLTNHLLCRCLGGMCRRR